MKHYLDIENLKEKNVILGDTITRYRNDKAFNKGDLIHITEKFDGSNASATFDTQDNTVHSFSHRQELSYNKTLNGFYNYISQLPFNIFKDNSDYIIFGEWSGCRNKIIYDAEHKGKWYIFDIWDKKLERWLEPKLVKQFCDKYSLTYIKVLYEGPFISWEDCSKYMNMPNYGKIQEGIVVRNITKMTSYDIQEKSPFILKLVNNEFKESMIKQPKEVDPEKEAAKEKAKTLIQAVVTRSRVEKILLKLQKEENIIPLELSVNDMRLVARVLPKAVFEDLLKEEPEVLNACGEFGRKLCSSYTMNIARSLILGN